MPTKKARLTVELKLLRHQSSLDSFVQSRSHSTVVPRQQATILKMHKLPP